MSNDIRCFCHSRRSNNGLEKSSGLATTLNVHRVPHRLLGDGSESVVDPYLTSNMPEVTLRGVSSINNTGVNKSAAQRGIQPTPWWKAKVRVREIFYTSHRIITIQYKNYDTFIGS